MWWIQCHSNRWSCLRKIKVSYIYKFLVSWIFNKNIYIVEEPNGERRNRCAKFTLKLLVHKLYPVWLYISIIKERNCLRKKILHIKWFIYKNLFLQIHNDFLWIVTDKYPKMWSIKNLSTCGSFIDNPATKKIAMGNLLLWDYIWIYLLSEVFLETKKECLKLARNN